MARTFDPVQVLSERFAAAIAAAFPQAADADPMITPCKQQALGDFQSNAAMTLAKRVGKNPREVAQALVQHVNLVGVAEPVSPASIAGPGFINVRLEPAALAGLLAAIDEPGLGITPPAHPSTIVVDLCGVNLAKQMHVGHLRATVIGDALARLFARLGWKALRQNHVGDWGLPIAMVTAKLQREVAAGRIDLARLHLDDLDRLYKNAQAECNADEAGLAAVERHGLGPKARAELEEQVFGARQNLADAKRTLVLLQSHDPATYAVWQRIYDITMTECLAICARLRADVRAEHTAGESSYAAELAEVVDDLLARGIAEHSEGAVVVRVEGFEQPLLIRKSDGGFLYATTDVAGVRRRVQRLGADRLAYAVDARQGQHFAQVFAACRKAGYARKPGASEDSVLQHAAFGMVLGDDGRPLKTRSGENVRLAALLDEAVERATRVVAEKIDQREDQIDSAERAAIAEAVGIAAIKYADLSNDRAKDYTFSFDRMLGFEGNTGPYLLYALVRIRSIFRKAAERGLLGGGTAPRSGRVGAGLQSGPWASAPLNLAHPAERALALTLLRYPGTLESAAGALEPHRICQYLYELAGAYSVFFDQCHVLNAPDEPTRLSRLRLCDLTGRVLADGLDTLGLPRLERM